MAGVPGLHSEVDAKVEEVGNAHYEDGKLIIGDTDVSAKMAAAIGVLQGGRQRGYFVAKFYKISSETVESDGTFGGAFGERSEPK